MDPNLPTRALITPGYQYNSDPTCREIDGRFYVFTTHDPFTVQFEKPNPYFKGMYDCHAYSTEDFDHWVDHGSLLNTHDAGWHKGNAVWDGDLGIPANGRYYAYIPFRMNPDEEENYGHYQIGVFAADRIEGPYVDVLGKPLATVDGKEIVGLSPTVVYSDNGEPYLLWGPDAGVEAHHTVSLAKLKPNMVELAEPAHDIAIEEYNRCGGLEYFESPLLFKRGDLWYLTYVAIKDLQGRRNDNYAVDDPPGCYIQYATSRSMFGPFNRNLRHLIYPATGADHNTQQGIGRYRGQWYAAYHLADRSIHRQVCVTPMNFEADGSLVPIFPDTDPGAGTSGFSSLTLDAFAHKREAEEFHERGEAEDERGIKGDYHFKLKDGGFLRFDRMDFGPGARGFRVEISCENRELLDGRLEFRLDRKDGRKIGEAEVRWTGGKTHYLILTGPVESVDGVHAVYLIARGKRGDASGRLFNVNWFTFTDAYRGPTPSWLAVDCGGKGDDELSPDRAYEAGSWGYEGETVEICTPEVVYYNANLPRALQSGRMGSKAGGTFRYRFTVPDGWYAVQLIFAEIAETEYGSRLFDVAINGRRVLQAFDILIAASGPNRVAVRNFEGVPPQDGLIRIEFFPLVGQPLINAIRIYPLPSDQPVK